MRIGVYFTASKNNGGVYQYSITLLKSLEEIKGNKYVIFTTSKDIPEEFYKSKSFKIVSLPTSNKDFFLLLRDHFSKLQHRIFPNFFRIIFDIGLFDLLTPVNKLINERVIERIENEKLDVVFYPTTSTLSFLIDIPSVVTIHDLHHRKAPEFLETSAGGRWEFREYTYRNICKDASVLLAESEHGKKDIVTYYQFDPENIWVLKMLPPSYLNGKVKKKVLNSLRKKHKISNKYIFYPAKFWPHKNHLNIIKAINLLKKRGITIDLVLSGSKEADFSTFEEVMFLAKKIKVRSQVKYVGYVNDEELSALYKWSVALVMPTFFGASNIPLLEAWKMKTAVIYTNIPGCREELGNAGLAVDPGSSKDIADKIEKVLSEPGLRKKLIRNGIERLNRWNEKKYKREIQTLLKRFF